MKNNTTPPRKIVIVGGGTAGWMTASLLQHAWSKYGTEITLIESADIGTIGVGEGSTPYLKTFFTKLGIEESEWMPACHATYKCGISFLNWSSDAEFNGYFHPFFSPLDLKSGNALFDNCGLRRRGYSADTHPNDFFVSATLARRQLSPIPEKKLPFIPDYGYHFDSVLLGRFLKNRAISLGINHLVGTVDSVFQHDNGDICEVSSKEHGLITADFFIDCSGFSGLLINKTLKEKFISFKENLFNDAAVAIPTSIEPNINIPSETVSKALSNGWMWKIPLMSRYGNGYVYSSKHISPQAAEKELRQHLGESAKGMPARHIKMRVGRVDNHWSHNCLAIGLSQGFIEPLEATALMLIQLSVEHFILNYEKGSYTSEYRPAYNKRINEFFDGVRDYVVAHYQLNQRNDSEYWRANRNNPHISENLKALLHVWDDGGDFEAFLTKQTKFLVYLRPSWYCILAGMGRFPTKVNSNTTKVSATPSDETRHYCESMARKFASHRTQLKKIYGSAWSIMNN
ncbi:MAG: tryptophan 7-halogenase [Thalassotalea sp.]|nr:tryptophan 7-halogenase [Thalassotalea sp.]